MATTAAVFFYYKNYGFIFLQCTIHSHYKAKKSQDIFIYKSDCVWMKEESLIELGWLEGE